MFLCYLSNFLEVFLWTSFCFLFFSLFEFIVSKIKKTEDSACECLWVGLTLLWNFVGGAAGGAKHNLVA